MHGLTEAAESMNCSNCNASNPPGAASCIKCHAPLGADEAQTLDGMPESRATPVTVGVAEPAAASLTVLKPGSVLGARYEILGLLGVGGMGKTRLALESASCQSGGFADGVWIVMLVCLVIHDGMRCLF